MTAGKLLAHAALQSVPFITFFPAYGAEVRGGTCHCQLILSSDAIGSPIAEQFDSILVMNQQSADMFLPQLAAKGIAVINQSLCRKQEDDRILFVPATELAESAGNPRSANLVMLGAFIAAKSLLPLEEMKSQIRLLSSGSKQALLDVNIRAFDSGVSAARTASR